MALTVLVPAEDGVPESSGNRDVRLVHYRPDGPLPPEAAEAEVLVPPFLGAPDLELVGRLPRLRLVQLLTAGAEAWVGRLPDGVALSTARGAHGGATAEWVLAVLLAIYRHLPRFVRAADAARWDFHPTETLLGKRVLIVGAGDVARQIATRLSPFEASATLLGRRERPGVAPPSALPQLLGEHDAVVLAVPLTAETTGMVDEEFLSRMADGAVLINAARGPVVRTDALLAELERGRLHAALDVTDPEPLPAEHPLWRAPNLLLTPHVGGSVSGRHERAFAVALEQIAAFAAGQDPPNLVSASY